MPTKNDVRRMDFKIEILNQNPKTGYFEFRLIPDPERYEIREHKRKKYYYDKFSPINEFPSSVEMQTSQL
jgi:hypothetical protein